MKKLYKKLTKFYSSLTTEELLILGSLTLLSFFFIVPMIKLIFTIALLYGVYLLIEPKLPTIRKFFNKLFK